MVNTVPVTNYPDKYIDELQDEINILKITIKSGKQPVFEDIETLISKLNDD